MTDIEFKRLAAEYGETRQRALGLLKRVGAELRRRWPINGWVRPARKNYNRYGVVRGSAVDPDGQIVVNVVFLPLLHEDTTVTVPLLESVLERLPASRVPVEYRRRALSEFWDKPLSFHRARPFFHCDTNINLDKV